MSNRRTNKPSLLDIQAEQERDNYGGSGDGGNSGGGRRVGGRNHNSNSNSNSNNQIHYEEEEQQKHQQASKDNEISVTRLEIENSQQQKTHQHNSLRIWKRGKSTLTTIKSSSSSSSSFSTARRNGSFGLASSKSTRTRQASLLNASERLFKNLIRRSSSDENNDVRGDGCGIRNSSRSRSRSGNTSAIGGESNSSLQLPMPSGNGNISIDNEEDEDDEKKGQTSGENENENINYNDSDGNYDDDGDHSVAKEEENQMIAKKGQATTRTTTKTEGTAQTQGRIEALKTAPHMIPPTRKKSTSSADSAAKEVARNSFVCNNRGPGAFSEGGRAFGERPAWAQSPRNNHPNTSTFRYPPPSLDRFSFVSHDSQQTDGDAERSLDDWDPLANEPTENDTRSIPNSQHSNSDMNCDIHHHYMITHLTAETHNLDQEELLVEEGPSTNESHHEQIPWYRRPKSNFCMSVTAVLLGTILIGLFVSGMQFFGDDTSADPSILSSPKLPCNTKLLEPFPGRNMVDEKVQCECQQQVAEMDETTLRAFKTMRNTVLEQLYPPGLTNNSEEQLSLQVVDQEFNTSMINCSQIQDVASLNYILANDEYASDLERYAFHVLYLSLNGGTSKTEWMNNSSKCRWFGVECEDEGTVIRLSLPSNNLEGKLPAEIGLLSNLETLDLSRNMRISGSLPHQLELLTNLVTLKLQQCKFSGSIPTEIGALTSLVALELQMHDLTGTIPSEMGKLKRLTSLELSSGKLTGTIPSELLLLSSLDKLHIEGNALIGNLTTAFQHLAFLTSLRVGSNKFTSSNIPPDFWGLTNLVELHVNDIHLSGSLPALGLGSLTNMADMRLGRSGLSGSIPSEVGLLTQISRLTMASNDITGSIPSEIGLLTKLISLDLSNNNLDGRIPDELESLQEILSLALERNPNVFGNLNRLCERLESESSSITVGDSGSVQINCWCCIYL
mmetsp:Transcript_11356/g.16196  ORF Transcript_11356/g.16196 Transcript_11356/m.16196 type:complete len:956 (+) Transcript_11356:275-3142(+)